MKMPKNYKLLTRIKNKLLKQGVEFDALEVYEYKNFIGRIQYFDEEFDDAEKNPSAKELAIKVTEAGFYVQNYGTFKLGTVDYCFSVKNRNHHWVKFTNK